MNKPLAERIRPRTLEDYISQEHLVGPKGALHSQLKSGMLSSMIFWGPPGTGKTTLASIIANTSERPFYTLSAVDSGVAAVREVINKAKKSDDLFTAKNPILFIDEIHRFSKSQQDSLLGAVEKGWITLIGATTENPSFEVIPALLSRCQVYILKPFSKKDLETLLNRAIVTDELLSKKEITLKETDALLRLSGGDARKLLNILELLVNSEDTSHIEITNERVQQKVQKNTVLYDKAGEQHYDIISAFIKSIRGSDPNAAVACADDRRRRGCKIYCQAHVDLSFRRHWKCQSYGFSYRKQHISGSEYNWISGSSYYTQPMRYLSRYFGQK